MVKRLDVSYTKLGTWFFCYRLWPANIYRSYFSKAILLMYFILVCTCLCFLIKFFMLFIKKKKKKNQEFLRGCLVSVFKQQFSVFKQHFTFFNTLFHPHVFPQKFLNNNFQFLNTCTKRALRNSQIISYNLALLKQLGGSICAFGCSQSTINFGHSKWTM